MDGYAEFIMTLFPLSDERVIFKNKRVDFSFLKYIIFVANCQLNVVLLKSLRILYSPLKQSESKNQALFIIFLPIEFRF